MNAKWESGENMRRRLSGCDFCGSILGLRSYPADARGIVWHSCEVCAAFIRKEDWQSLIDRIIAAYATLQHISDSEQNAFRHELENAFCRPLENEVNASRTSHLFPA